MEAFLFSTFFLHSRFIHGTIQNGNAVHRASGPSDVCLRWAATRSDWPIIKIKNSPAQNGLAPDSASRRAARTHLMPCTRPCLAPHAVRASCCTPPCLHERARPQVHTTLSPHVPLFSRAQIKPIHTCCCSSARVLCCAFAPADLLLLVRARCTYLKHALQRIKISTATTNKKNCNKQKVCIVISKQYILQH